MWRGSSAASVRDSDISETLKRSLDCDEPDLTYKRPVVNRFTPRIVGETSRAVFDAVASSCKPQLPLQAWEHGVFGYICGNNHIVPMPTFPKLEQPALHLRLDPVGHSGPLGLLRVFFLSLLPLCSLGSVGHSGPLSPLLLLYLFSLLFSLLLHHCLDSVGHSGPLGLWQPPLSSLLLPSPFLWFT